MENKNQKLILPTINKEKDCLDMLIQKDNQYFRISLHRSEIVEFLLKDTVYSEVMKEGVEIHHSNGGRSISIKEYVDDYSYDYKSDRELQDAFAASVYLSDQEPVYED